MTVKLMQGDCLELMCKLPEHSVDLILNDPPYGITAAKWDSIIDFDRLWEEYKRVLKPYGTVLLFSSGTFTYKVIGSNLDWFKYKLIWVKNHSTAANLAHWQPMRAYEEINVFSNGVAAHTNQPEKNMTYNPQGLRRLKQPRLNSGRRKADSLYRKANDNWQRYTGYPNDVLKFNTPEGKKHPSQKPVDLLRYLIKTYSNEGETVLDNTMGSGSTGIAAVQTKRDFIGIEYDDNYFKIAKENIYNAQKQQVKQLSLFDEGD